MGECQNLGYCLWQRGSLSKGFTPWKIHFTFWWVRYFGKGIFTFGASLCHHRPVPGCAGASWVLPARREREKKIIIFMGSPWRFPLSLKTNPSFESTWKKKNPSSATYEISNLEIHNNDKETNILLIIQHKIERKYQSYKNNTQSKREMFSFPSWMSLIPEMLLGRAPAPAPFVLQSKPIQALH